MTSEGARPPATIDAEALVRRLDAELAGLAGRSPILAFDADGTLWTGDVGVDLFEALLEAGAVRDAAREALADEARGIGLRADTDATSLARSLYSAFEAGRWPEPRAFAAMAWAFAGYSVAEMDAFAAGVLEARALASRVRRSLVSV
ncbi:MAG TPA: haloacid dehalogenase-like hydrolase, partial [Minicystis sp.]|nr:haloacid dehalogenase-like hydrolase [Minicystis sp.]